MAGTYEIVKKVDHPTKFACYVKFNEAIDLEFYEKMRGDAKQYPEGGEYWEHDSLDPVEISAALQSTADADAARWEAEDAVKAQQDSFEIKDGKLVI